MSSRTDKEIVAYCGQHCNYAIAQDNKKSPFKQIAAIRMDAISWHYFKCQQQTRYSLGRWWWRGVFRWTCGGNTTAHKNNGPKLRGTISIIINVIHFVLFWKHDKDDELWIFWTVLRIVRHKSKRGWAAGKSATVGYICIADTFCCVFFFL